MAPGLNPSSEFKSLSVCGTQLLHLENGTNNNHTTIGRLTAWLLEELQGKTFY